MKAEIEVIKKEIALREEKEAARLKAKKQQSLNNSEEMDFNLDATCTIQDSIHVYHLVHKYVYRILGTYQRNQRDLPKTQTDHTTADFLFLSYIILDNFFHEKE